MSRNEAAKPRKTFPLEIEENLHKSLKIKAIKEGKTLHSLIIDTLSARVQDESGEYRAKPKRKGTAQ